MYKRCHYTIRLKAVANGVVVEEVAIENGLRGVIAGVVFDSQTEALNSAHHLAMNLIGK